MRLSTLGQLAPATLKSLDAQVFICASGYETRCRFAAQRFGIRAERNVVFGFTESTDDPRRSVNDAFFASAGFESELVAGGDEIAAETAFLNTLGKLEHPSPTVVIDISSMTRTWYGSLLRLLVAAEDVPKLRTVFLYSPAKYHKSPKDLHQNEFVGPVRGFSGLTLPDRPTCLMVGLGYEPGRALGIYEALDPELVACFMARPAGDPRYESAALRANADFLPVVSIENQFDYPLADFLTTYQRLEGFCRGLGREAGIVLAPLGPKVFSLCALLVASIQPEVSVWRVSPGSRGEASDALPDGRVIAVDTVWQPSFEGMEALSGVESAVG